MTRGFYGPLPTDPGEQGRLFYNRRYQRRFYPIEKSRSQKSVTDWGREWIDVTDK